MPELGWRAVDDARVAPIELLHDPDLRAMMTTARCAHVLDTPRGRAGRSDAHDGAPAWGLRVRSFRVDGVIERFSSDATRRCACICEEDLLECMARP